MDHNRKRNDLKILCFICYCRIGCLFVKREISTNVFLWNKNCMSLLLCIAYISFVQITHWCLLQERVASFTNKWITFVMRHFEPLKSNIWAYCKYDNKSLANKAIDAKGCISNSHTNCRGFYLVDRLDSKQTYFSSVSCTRINNKFLGKNLHLIYRKTYVKA